MANEETKEETRQSRFFLFQDGKHVVIGKQYVRYEPDVAKCVFGTIKVETFFPVRREAKHSFRLDLYPEVHDQRGDDIRKNIVPVNDGVHMLFIEANRSAALQSRSITHVKREDFTYDYLTTLTEDMVTAKDNGFTVDTFILKGKITKDFEHLRKGDLIDVGDCQEITDPKDSSKKSYVWHCRWDPSKVKFGLADKFRKIWYRMFNKQLYKKRYVDFKIMDLNLENVLVMSGHPVEPGTDRGEE